MSGRLPGEVALHPVALGALAVWALNDHVLKAALHSELTGKLSDVASLVAFPLLAAAAGELLARRRSNGLLLGWVLATGLVMATINTMDVAAEAYRVGLAALQWPAFALGAALAGEALPALHRVHLTVDPSDLWTLPALLVPLAVGWAHAPRVAPAEHSRPGARLVDS